MQSVQLYQAGAERTVREVSARDFSQSQKRESMKTERYYVTDLNDPKLRERYERFKVWKGIPYNEPCSDKEREEFERYVLGNQRYERLKGELQGEIDKINS